MNTTNTKRVYLAIFDATLAPCKIIEFALHPRQFLAFLLHSLLSLGQVQMGHAEPGETEEELGVLIQKGQLIR